MVRGAGSETAFCEARGFSTGCVSSGYRDAAHGLRHPNKFDVAVLASPFLSVLVFVLFLFFRDVSGPLHHPLMRMRQMWNVLVYAFCVILGVAQATYEEQVNNNEIEVRRECAQISSGSTW
jgi:hypothetical protein